MNYCGDDFFTVAELVEVRQANPDGSLSIGGYAIYRDYLTGVEKSRSSLKFHFHMLNVRECLPIEYMKAGGVIKPAKPRWWQKWKP